MKKSEILKLRRKLNAGIDSDNEELSSDDEWALRNNWAVSRQNQHPRSLIRIHADRLQTL
jgi:hypothetical protein